MTTVGFHASHEQIPPGALLRAVIRAEEAGFDAAMCSDHFAPWTSAQGESGFAFAWLGAALASTTLPFGVVTAPGQRYHPAVTAQAIATLGEMFPGRFWAALGSGEAMNEHITGDGWPAKEVRDARLRECADVIRALLAGEEVTHTGLVTVDRARLWTLPSHPPALLAAAVSADTAGRVAEWADGLITVAQAPDAWRASWTRTVRQAAAVRSRFQVHLSFAESEEDALAIASEQWRAGVVEMPLAWDLDSPERSRPRAPTRRRTTSGRRSSCHPTRANWPTGSPRSSSSGSTACTCITWAPSRTRSSTWRAGDLVPVLRGVA